MAGPRVARSPVLPRVSRGPTRRDARKWSLVRLATPPPRTEVSNASAADDSSSEAAADADMVDDLLNMSVQHVGAAPRVKPGDPANG